MTRLAIVMLAVLAFSCGADETTPGAASGGGAGGSGATGGAPSGGSGGTASGGTGGTTSGGSAGTSGKGGGGGGPDCLAQARGIEVAEVDLDGFPSYTVDGCTLAYVSAKSKALVVRDLATGSETSVESAAGSPPSPQPRRRRAGVGNRRCGVDRGADTPRRRDHHAQRLLRPVG